MVTSRRNVQGLSTQVNECPQMTTHTHKQALSQHILSNPPQPISGTRIKSLMSLSVGGIPPRSWLNLTRQLYQPQSNSHFYRSTNKVPVMRMKHVSGIYSNLCLSSSQRVLQFLANLLAELVHGHGGRLLRCSRIHAWIWLRGEGSCSTCCAILPRS